jgi:Predicted phosphatases
VSHPYADQVQRLVLWDVDHTLVENNGVSKQIYAAAFTALTGRPAVHPPPTEGRTDREITRLLFAAHGLPVPTWPIVAEALERAGAALFDRLRERGWALPGAADCLRALAGRPDVVQSVLTGNIRPNARVKLAAFGLDDLVDLDVGGYGADGVERAELVVVAQERAAAKYGGRFDARSTVLIGDTPRDVEAGRDGGALVVAVATGEHSADELRRAGASMVLPDLINVGRLVAAVLA